MRSIPLVDGRVVAQTFAMRREVTRPAPLGDGHVLADAQAYGSVLKDPTGQWKMWYLYEPNDPVYCEYFATSRDGLAWERPELDLIAAELRPQTAGPNSLMGPGQKDSDGRWLVEVKGPEGFCVLDAEITPHPAARSRYTVMYLARFEDPDPAKANGLCLAHSDDGLHWTADKRNPVVPGWRDTANMFFYDPRLGLYVKYGRPEAYVASGREANRLICRATSPDLYQWQAERTVLDTDDIDADPFDLVDEVSLHTSPSLDDARERARIVAELTEGRSAEGRGPAIRGRNRQWYGVTVFPWAECYLGLAWMYDLPSGMIWIELVHSYDGIDWRRETCREPFIAAPPGAMRLTMSSPPVEVGDEIRIYSSTSDQNHHGVPASSTYGIDVHALKRDRWVGYAAYDRPGELLTQPLKRGDDLALNAATSDDGWVRVAVLDACGSALEGYSLEECEPLSGDCAELRPFWTSGRTVRDIAPDEFRLRIVAKNARVFALTV